MLFSRFAQSAAVFVLLTIGFAAPAYAQNNKQIISGAWYEDRATQTGPVSQLVVTFAKRQPTNF